MKHTDFFLLSCLLGALVPGLAGCEKNPIGDSLDLAQVEGRMQKLDTVAGTFAKLTPPPTARNGLKAFSDGTSIHMVAGLNKDFLPVNVFETFDPATGQYRTRTPWPNPRNIVGGVTHTGNLFCLPYGAVTLDNHMPTPIIDCFDPIKDEWITLPELPNNVDVQNMGGHGGKIYVFGGTELQQNGMASDRAFVFDPSTMQWTELPKMPLTCPSTVSVTVGDILYVLGCGSGTNYALVSFDTQTQMWSTLAAGPGTLALDKESLPTAYGNGFVFLGVTNFGKADEGRQVLQYDATGNTWIVSAPLPLTKPYTLPALIGDQFFVRVQGEGQNTPSGKIYVYDLKAKTWTLLLDDPAAAEALECRAVPVGTSIFYPGSWSKLGLFSQ